MKKILALLLAVVMAFAVSVTVFAGPGQFVQSPSNNNAPELIEGENENEDCTAKLVVTPYKDRKTLPADKLAEIEKVYGIIAAGVDLTSLNAQFKAYVAGLGLAASNLAYSVWAQFDNMYVRALLDCDSFVGTIDDNTVCKIVEQINSSEYFYERLYEFVEHFDK